MESDRFDQLTRSAAQTGSRRRLVQAVLGGALGVGLTRRVTDVAARHHHHGGGGGGGGGCIPLCGLAICGPDGCGGSCGTCPTGQTCQAGQCLGGGGGGGGGGGDRCAGPTGICNADPTPCGHSANGDTCGCELSVEGTTFCADGANPCPVKRECTSTAGDEATSCKNLPGAGLHFFCQAAKTCGCGLGTTTGKVCVAECDNPGSGGGGGGGGSTALPLRTTCNPGTDTCAAGLQCDAPTTRHTCSDTVHGISDWCCVPPGGSCTECDCCGNYYCAFDNNNQPHCRPNPEGGGGSGGACATDNDCNGHTPDCCNGACVDLLGDATNCGTCGRHCPAGQTCGAGLCAVGAASARHRRRGQRAGTTRRR